MKRILVDYKKLDRKLATMLIESYPNGYGDEDIIAFTNARGEIVQAVELRTEDALYLVKISKVLNHFISNFEDVIEKELEASENSPGKHGEVEHNFEKESGEDIELD
ncbi:MAG: hypothetical protein ABF293_02995 [Flavobacteriaceae bacterium]